MRIEENPERAVALSGLIVARVAAFSGFSASWTIGAISRLLNAGVPK